MHLVYCDLAEPNSETSFKLLLLAYNDEKIIAFP
jgi:hypothetical protein